MNIFKYSCVLGLALVVAVACKKQALMTYDLKDNIYFRFTGTTGQITDSMNFTFATAPVAVKDSFCTVPVWVTGAPADHDRTYKILVIDSNTTAVAGKHYEMPAALVFRAGRVNDTMRLKLIRTADMQTQILKLKIALVENSDFQVGIETLGTSINTSNVYMFRFNISDQLVAGPYWTGIFGPFGTFSVKKVRLINQITGMPLDYYNTGWFTDLNVNARVSYWAITMSRYLKDQKAAGNTIYEDDGVTEMKMGANYQ